MNSDAAAPRVRSTWELCREAGITRNVLSRIRRQYEDRLSRPIAIGNSLCWSDEALGQVRAIVAEEDRLREQVR